uniref:Putative ovule protein n=1 Tax=Solanum chacoense TaxID=4108 RepID=A0A0V0IEY6_SOLCH
MDISFLSCAEKTAKISWQTALSDFNRDTKAFLVVLCCPSSKLLLGYSFDSITTHVKSENLWHENI